MVQYGFESQVFDYELLLFYLYMKQDIDLCSAANRYGRAKDENKTHS